MLNINEKNIKTILNDLYPRLNNIGLLSANSPLQNKRDNLTSYADL